MHFTWKAHIFADDTYERGTPGQSYVCFMFLWNFTKDEELHLPSLYRIPKLHKFPFKQQYIASSANCCTKPLSKLLTCIPSAVKTGLHSYCDTSYSRGGVNRKWILKKGHILLCKKENSLILPKSSLKLISSTCASF